MPNRLPKGKLLAMAPHYGIGLELPLAEAAAQALVDKLGAKRLPGTRKDLLALLETPPPDPVALLYFNGHGAFATDAAGISRLKLERGTNSPRWRSAARRCSWASATAQWCSSTPAR